MQDMSEVITEYVKIGKHNIKNGIVFLSHDIGVKSIEMWCHESLCPLSKARFRKPLVTESGRIKGRRDFLCSHGIKFTSKSASKRPWQRVKYTGCPVRIALCEQEDGTWVISNCNVTNHIGHCISEADYFCHKRVRKITKEEGD